jgi:hypothetical protein
MVGFDVKPAVGIGRTALIRRFGADNGGALWDAPGPMTPWTGIYVGCAIGTGVGNTKKRICSTSRVRR